jgi:hypothetical protein
MGHIVNPISYRLSRSKFWLSSWNNISKKNYKILIFEDHNLIRIFNWFREFNMWKKFNITITNINFLKFYNKLVININMGLLDYYYSSRYLKNLPLYQRNQYLKLRVNNLYNSGKKSVLKNVLGKFIKYYISKWGYLLFIIKNNAKFSIQYHKRLKLVKSIYKISNVYNKYNNIILNKKEYKLKNNKENNNTRLSFHELNLKNKLHSNSYSISYLKGIKGKPLNKRFFENFLKFIRYTIWKNTKFNIKVSLNNNIYKVYNNYGSYFNFSKKLNKFFFKNYNKPYFFKSFEINIRKDNLLSNILNNYNYSNNNKYNVINYNYINLLRGNQKNKKYRLLKNIRLNTNFFFQYNIMYNNNINMYNGDMNSNLLTRSYKKGLLNSNNKKAFHRIFNDSYNTIMYIRQRFNFYEYRYQKFLILSKDSNWNSFIKKEFFIGLFLKNFLIYIIKKIFFIKNNIVINIYEQNHGILERNALGLKKTILVRIAAQYRIGHLIGILKRKLENNKNVKGFRIRALGRYQKKLRNRKIEVNYGRIRISNINTPISYINFIIIYKFGTCGIKINLLRNSYNYEIL